MSVSQHHFIDSCNNMKMFMAMCRGLLSKDNVCQLADFSDPMHASLPDKRQHDPAVVIVKEEVRRRTDLWGLPKVSSASMTRASLLEWLDDLPHINPKCINWLHTEEEKLCLVAQQAKCEQSRLETEKLLSSNWNSSNPWLRLHCAMVDDRARSASLNKDSTKDRAKLDIGDSVDRPDTFEEAVARICNDPDILFTAE